MSKTEKLKEAFDSLDECDKLITERIFENNTIGKEQHMMTQQASHAFALYRKLIWNAKYIIRDLIEEKK